MCGCPLKPREELTVHPDGDRPCLGRIDVVVLGHTLDLLVVHLPPQPEHKKDGKSRTTWSVYADTDMHGFALICTDLNCYALFCTGMHG